MHCISESTLVSSVSAPALHSIKRQAADRSIYRFCPRPVRASVPALLVNVFDRGQSNRAGMDGRGIGRLLGYEGPTARERTMMGHLMDIT